MWPQNIKFPRSWKLTTTDVNSQCQLCSLALKSRLFDALNDIKGHYKPSSQEKKA